MTDEEAVELGQRAIYHATFRDAMSGGINNGTQKPKRARILLCVLTFLYIVVGNVHSVLGQGGWLAHYGS